MKEARDISSTAPGTTITPNQDTATSPEISVNLPSISDATESISRLSSVGILDFTSPISTFTTSTIVPALAGSLNGSPSSSTSTSLTSVPANASNQGQGLTNGAKAGIGFGAALGVVVLLGIAGVLSWRHLKRNKKGARETTLIVLAHDQEGHYEEEKPELPAISAVADDGRWGSLNCLVMRIKRIQSRRKQQAWSQNIMNNDGMENSMKRADMRRMNSTPQPRLQAQWAGQRQSSTTRNRILIRRLA